MGSTSKVCSVILRVWELVCSAVVLGLTARFVNLIIRAGASNDARIVYTLCMACISTLYSILFMPPLMYNFVAFAADFILFVMWLVAFCLLVTVSILPTTSRRDADELSVSVLACAMRTGTTTTGAGTGGVAIDGRMEVLARTGGRSWPSPSWRPFRFS